MTNTTLSMADSVWHKPGDYIDQTLTLTALTTTHYHFCPWFCDKGHDEEHVLLEFLWDYLDWYHIQYKPPSFTVLRSHTVATFCGRFITSTVLTPTQDPIPRPSTADDLRPTST